MAKKKAEYKPLTAWELQEIWRNKGAIAAVPSDDSCHDPAPDFIGPTLGGMALWFARGRPKSAWEVAADERRLTERGVQADLFA